MRIGVTGHQLISNETRPWVINEIKKLLSEYSPVTGVSSLAAGADQLFAESVLEVGGTLVAIIPFPDYERTFKQGSERAKYFSLQEQALEIQVLPDIGDEQESFLAAGKLVTDQSDFLIAVWDGKPAKGKGGTGDAVAYALSKGRRVVHVNPDRLLTQELKER